MNISFLQSHPNPAHTYTEAVNRFDQIQKSELSSPLYAPSLSKLLVHGQRTKRVILWFHGYTNSPHGFSKIAQTCFEQGDNVYVPRAPYHGYMDRLTTDTALITASNLRKFADSSLDIAAGLGDEIIIGGLSMGGVITAWLAQKRANIQRAIIISPAFGARSISKPFTDLMTIYLLIRPNYFRWWNPGDENIDYTQPSDRYHSYPRISMHGLAQIFRLGLSARRAGHFRAPLAQEVWWILNDNDFSINNPLNYTVFKRWHHNAPQRVHAYIFPASLQLGHDIIDPSSVTQKINVSYPVIMNILNGQNPH